MWRVAQVSVQSADANLGHPTGSKNVATRPSFPPCTVIVGNVAPTCTFVSREGALPGVRIPTLSATQGEAWHRCPLATPLEGNMRDIQQLLREKEEAIAQLRREVEALRSVTPLLSETGVFIPRSFVNQKAGIETDAAIGAALVTVGPLLADENEFDPGIRARLAEATENDFKRSSTNGISRQLRRIAAPLLRQM